ncbi:MAG: 5-formyltetrahydrofolate cyclo-ligase [Deltaproteobacteria bacterium]|nr:5-formyltetrahydrofolate cyclo-ligase [Deltaproteobacteria bacterium]
MISKKALRKHLQDLRKNQFRRTIVRQSKQITDRLLAFESYQQSQVVGLYDGLDFEVQTENIFLHAISQGKVCLYPKVVGANLIFGQVSDPQELEKDKFGVRAPQKIIANKKQLQCLIVPCVGVDLWGRRLGFGGGFYDRYLQNFQGTTIALAFDYQVYPLIPDETHDKRVDWIVTSHKIYRCH